MKSGLLTITFIATLAMTAVAYADEGGRTVSPDNGFAPGLLLGALLVVAVLLVLIGIGIVIGLVCVALASAFLALGILSTSALVGILHGRLSVGFRALHYQLCAVIGLPCGIGVLWLGTALAEFHLRHRYILLIGSAVGIMAGICIAFVLDLFVRLLDRRLFRHPGYLFPHERNA